MTIKRDEIEVLQVALTGTTKPGKWYVQRGNQYLNKDLEWHSNTSTGGFFFETEDEANIAKQAIQKLKPHDSAPPP